MGSILCSTSYTNETTGKTYERHYFCGNISKIAGNDSDDKPFKVTVRVSVYNKETKKNETKSLILSGWNNEKTAWADRLRKMKLKVGAFVCGTCYGYKRMEYNGRDFFVGNISSLTYGGEYSFENKGKSYQMLCGHVGLVNDRGGLSLAVNAYNRENKEQETHWYNVNFDDDVRSGLETAKGLQKGANICMIVKPVKTEKETRNPVVQCIRFGVSNPEAVMPKKTK